MIQPVGLQELLGSKLIWEDIIYTVSWAEVFTVANTLAASVWAPPPPQWIFQFEKIGATNIFLNLETWDIWSWIIPD